MQSWWKSDFCWNLAEYFVQISLKVLHLVIVDSAYRGDYKGWCGSQQAVGSQKYWTQCRWQTSCGEFPEVGDILVACLCVCSSTSPGSGSGPWPPGQRKNRKSDPPCTVGTAGAALGLSACGHTPHPDHKVCVCVCYSVIAKVSNTGTLWICNHPKRNLKK